MPQLLKGGWTEGQPRLNFWQHFAVADASDEGSYNVCARCPLCLVLLCSTPPNPLPSMLAGPPAHLRRRCRRRCGP